MNSHFCVVNTQNIMTCTHKYYTQTNNEITFIDSFNESMDEYYDILSQCKILRFPTNSIFNKPFVLVPSITHIYLGSCYNQPIFLTHNVVHILFGYKFNHPIILPPNVKHFEMNACFNQSISLPKNLTHVTTGIFFNRPLCLSKNNVKIYIGELFRHPIIFPKYTKRCTLIGDPTQFDLTKNIKWLYVGACSNQPLFLNKNLVSVVIRCGINYPIILGKNIKDLTIGYAVKFDMILPKYLKIFVNPYNSQLRLIFENPLKTICLGQSNNWLTDNIPNKTLQIVLWVKINDSVLKNNLPSDAHVAIERM